MVKINKLVKSMNKGGKDCMQEGKQYRFPVFLGSWIQKKGLEKGFRTWAVLMNVVMNVMKKN